MNDYVKWTRGMHVYDSFGVSVTVVRSDSLVNSVFVRYPDGSERELAAEAVTVPEADVFVDITDAVPGTVKIPASELRVGDQVFDVFGTPHMLTAVRFLAGGIVRTKRTDQTHFEYWEAADTITVLPVSETDTMHQRISNDCILYLGTDLEYRVISVNRHPLTREIGYRVRVWDSPDAPVLWMPHNRFRRP